MLFEQCEFYAWFYGFESNQTILTYFLQNMIPYTNIWLMFAQNALEFQYTPLLFSQCVGHRGYAYCKLSGQPLLHVTLQLKFGHFGFRISHPSLPYFRYYYCWFFFFSFCTATNLFWPCAYFVVAYFPIWGYNHRRWTELPPPLITPLPLSPIIPFTLGCVVVCSVCLSVYSSANSKACPINWFVVIVEHTLRPLR